MSSGISFRKLPDPSLQAIVDICNHYEAKCAGKYETLVSRYLIQMKKEILSQVYALAQSAKDDEKLFVELESIVNEWNENFEDMVEEGGNNSIITRHVTPFYVRNVLNKQKDEIQLLKDALAKSKEETCKIRSEMAKDLDKNVDVFRKSAAIERRRHRQIIDEMKSEFSKDTECLKSSLQKAKEETEASLRHMQETAEEAISKSERKRNKDINKIKESMESIKKRLTEDLVSERKRFQRKIKSLEEHKAHSLNELQVKLEREHAIKIANMKRQFSLEKSRAHVKSLNDAHDQHQFYYRAEKSEPFVQTNHEATQCFNKYNVNTEVPIVGEGLCEHCKQSLPIQRESECLKARVNELENIVMKLLLSRNEDTKIQNFNFRNNWSWKDLKTNARPYSHGSCRRACDP